MLGRLRGHVTSNLIEMGGLPMLGGIGGRVPSNLMMRWEGYPCWEGLEARSHTHTHTVAHTRTHINPQT